MTQVTDPTVQLKLHWENVSGALEAWYSDLEPGLFAQAETNPGLTD